MAGEAQGSNALDGLFGALDRLGSYWVADRQAKREDSIAERQAKRDVFTSGGRRSTAPREPLSPQTMAAYAAVAMVLVATLGLTLRLVRGRGQ